MGIVDFFKRTGNAYTAENVQAKAREVGAEISEKESVVAKMRAELPNQVLDGDHLGAHRIEHEERELNALKITKAELEAKARELRASEAATGIDAQWKGAEEKGRQLEQAGAEYDKLIADAGLAGRKLVELDAAFRASLPARARDWQQELFASYVTAQLSRLGGVKSRLHEHVLMGFKAR